MARLFWHVADQLEYLVTLAQLRIWTRCAVPSRRRRPIGSGRKIGSGYGGHSPRSNPEEPGCRDPSLRPAPSD
jgi:hypothetical protein